MEKDPQTHYSSLDGIDLMFNAAVWRFLYEINYATIVLANQTGSKTH